MPDRDNQEVKSMRRKFLLACTVFGCVGLSVFAAPAKADRWLTYHNDRYGTAIDYPDQFKPELPPDADDGRRFKDAAGVEFAVYASYNALDFNLAKYQDYILKHLDPGQVVTYQAHGGNWFVISGTKGDGIFYERHLLSHGGQMTEAFSIAYPTAAKQTYAPLVARMSKSLRPGKGFQSP